MDWLIPAAFVAFALVMAFAFRRASNVTPHIEDEHDAIGAPTVADMEQWRV